MRVAILTGGETGEREVSIRSAQNVAENISFAEITTYVFPEDREKFFAEAKSFDVVIPVIHGLGGEDGALQQELSALGIPFIFSQSEAHAIGINKRTTKERTREVGITSPEETDTPPFFAKPIAGGSSVASKLCNTKEEFNELQEANPHEAFITETTIKGREFTVGVLERDNKTFALPVIEIIPKGSFFDFTSKYDPAHLASEICPADISPELAEKLQQQALDIHIHIGCRHISRSDFIVTPENKIYFLEINTVPGMTKTSLIPKMLTEVNLSLEEVLQEWCLAETKQ